MRAKSYDRAQAIKNEVAQCNAPTGVKGQTLAKKVRLLGKSTRSYGEPKVTKFISPKVDVQAWPLSNTTVQEELL